MNKKKRLFLFTILGTLLFASTSCSSNNSENILNSSSIVETNIYGSYKGYDVIYEMINP